MDEKLLSQVAVEVSSFFEHLELGLLLRIPESVINYYKENASNEYNFVFNDEKDLESQNLKRETKYIIAKIYYKYICDNLEKENYKKLVKHYEEKLEQEKLKKYNPDNIFANRRVEEKQSLEVVKEESLFRRLINKIFKRKKYK